MKPFSIEERHRKILQIDHQTGGDNTQDINFKDEYLDINAIDLDLTENLFRIFDFDRFISDLRENKLTLVRPKKWQDPFENFLLNSQGQLDDGTFVNFRPIRDSFYGQCWTLKEECDGLWRNFKSGDKCAVKVKTNSKKLFETFYDFTNKFHNLSYFIGKVEYVSDDEIESYFKEKIDFFNFQNGIGLAYTLLLKRTSFAYENEVRVIFHKPSTDEIDIHELNNPWDNSDLFKVQIDINELFEEVIFDPWIQPNEFDTKKQEIRNIGYTGPITRSSLYDRPFFVARI